MWRKKMSENQKSEHTGITGISIRLEVISASNDDKEQSDTGYESKKNGKKTIKTDTDQSDTAPKEKEKTLQENGETEEESRRYAMFWRVHLLSSMTVLLYMAGFVMSSPILSQYVYFRLGLVYFNSTNHSVSQSVPCDDNATSEKNELQERVQAETSHLQMYLHLVSSIPTIVINFVLGSYSDYLGRKMLFILPITGAVVKSATFVLVTALEFDLNYLYFGYVCDGIGGGLITLLLALFSVNADVTPPRGKRTIAIVVIESLLGLAAAAASVATGLLIQELGYVYPCVMMLALVVASGITSIGFIPETAPPRKARLRLSPLVHVRNVLSFYVEGTRKRRAQYVLVMAALLLYVLTFLGRSGVLTLFQINRPFCWDAAKVGYYGALSRVLHVLVSIGGIFFLQRYVPLELQATLAFLSVAASLVLEGLALNDVMLYMVAVVGMFSSLSAPVVRSILSRLTSPEKQGAMFSGVAAFEGICSAASSAIYNSVYAATLPVFRGLVFLVMAWACVVSAILMVCFRRVSGGEDITYRTESLDVKPTEHYGDEKHQMSSVPSEKALP